METLFDRRQRRLLELLQTRFDGSQTRLAEAIGRTSAYVSFLLTDKGLAHHKNLGEKLARHIEEALGLADGWLDGQEQPKTSGRGVIQFEDRATLPGYTMVPRRTVSLSAGRGSLAIDDEEAPPLAFRTEWLAKERLRPEKLVVAYARGDSMLPRIHDADTMLIDTTAHNFEDGKIYAVRVGEDLRVKRVFVRTQSVILHSDNPAYPPEEIPVDRVDKIHVIGRVVWVSGSL